MKRRISLLLVFALVVLPISGCLSTRVTTSRGDDPETASVSIAVFADPDAEKDRRSVPPPTLVELSRLGPSGEAFLTKSLARSWGAKGLPPGRYRVRVAGVLDPAGRIGEPRSGDRTTDFSVDAGERADVRIVLKKTPVGLVVIAAITVVILVVAVAILLREQDVHLPAPPSPGEILRHLPPPRVDAILLWSDIAIAVEDARARDAFREREGGVAPRVTSVFPDSSSRGIPPGVVPSLTFSQPLDGIPEDAVEVVGSRSGVCPGRVSLRRGLLRFEPDRPFLPGETVTVTVRADRVVGRGRAEMAADFEWSFRVGG